MQHQSLLAPALLPLWLIAATPAVAPQAAPTNDYTQLVVFGDSLSDNGNYFTATANPPAPYWHGRFTNGPVWVEQMLNHLGLSPAELDDRAVGFAPTGDVLNLQVLPYVAAHAPLDPDALYVYWAGANDVFQLLETPGGDPTVMIAQGMQNTGDALLALVAGGAQHIMVANLPDLSRTPLIVELGDPNQSNAVAQLATTYNTYLAQTLASLESALGVDFTEFDAHALTTQLVLDPSSGGFTVVDARALAPTGVVAPKLRRYMFWDHVHPTTKAHSFIMGAALAELGVLWGDVNGDGLLDARDFRRLELSYGHCPPGTPADLDGDGHVDPEDLRLLRALIY
ncbi:MAG: hypothetical protein KDC14_07005 [Planctomycetes bacterium]|nr:hypothetical protein [Planctomycetota bacterium]